MSTPGKFEGEPNYVPDFWDRAMDGFADTDLDGTFIFNITEEDHAKYPELPVGSRLYLVESCEGFVFSRVVGGGGEKCT